MVEEKQDKTLHLEKRKIGNPIPIVTQQQSNPVCRNHEDFYPGSRKSSLLALLAGLSPCPWGGNHLFSKVSGFILWEILYCLLFFVARSKVGIEKYILYLGMESFPNWLPAGAGKGAQSVVFGLSNYRLLQSRCLCLCNTYPQKRIGFSAYLHWLVPSGSNHSQTLIKTLLCTFGLFVCFLAKNTGF